MWYHVRDVVKSFWISPKRYRLETDGISHHVVHLSSEEIMWYITSADLVCEIIFYSQIWDENKTWKHLKFKPPYITFPLILHYCTMSTLFRNKLLLQSNTPSFSPNVLFSLLLNIWFHPINSAKTDPLIPLNRYSEFINTLK